MKTDLSPDPMRMPETPLDALGEVVRETVNFEDRTFLIEHPRESDRLLDHPAIRSAFAADEYMPYWADLWPASRMLAKVILKEPWGEPPPSGGGAGEPPPSGGGAGEPPPSGGGAGEPPLSGGGAGEPSPSGGGAGEPPLSGGGGGPLAVLEIGCGLGLPGIAALAMGLRVTFSDYDATALRFAAENARLNGFEDFETLQLDWRYPPAGRTFPVILAADLIYEMRNVEPLVELIKQMLAPDGVCLLTDQDRVPSHVLRQKLADEGLPFTTRMVRAGEPGGRRFKGTLYRIRRSA